MNKEYSEKNILTVNPGSTAVKYTFFEGEEVREHKVFSRKQEVRITAAERNFLQNLDPAAIAVRVVHTGEKIEPGPWDQSWKEALKQAEVYAPRHNQLAHDCIELLTELFPQVPMIAVPDTYFHRHLPEEERLYGIAWQHYEEGVRRFGFHGVALESIIKQLPMLLQKQGKEAALPEKIIVAHLGGGVSITAIKDGKSVATSMGISPLEGPLMTTRSGSVDPVIPELLGRRHFLTPDQVVEELYEQSGFYGLTGTSDTKYIFEQAKAGVEPYRLAAATFVRQVQKYIFAYAGLLQGVDVLVFSGGMGENNAWLREQILEGLSFVGITEEKAIVVSVKESEVLREHALRVLDELKER